MRSLALSCGLVMGCLVILAGCGSGGDWSRKQQATDVLPGEASDVAKAEGMMNWVATPAYAVIKGTACVGSVVLGAPVIGTGRLLDEPAIAEAGYRAVGTTCYGSYSLDDSDTR